MRFFAILGITIALSWTAWIRTDGFAPWVVEKAHSSLFTSPLHPKIDKVLSQPFHYFKKGRQSFVFESADGQFVLKFFNRKYLRIPWYSFFWREKEKKKRSLRRHFYRHSYQIAYQEGGEGILYLHLAPTADLPLVLLSDRAKRSFQIDLNSVSFVLQKKGEPIYPFLETIVQKEGLEGLYREIDHFVEAIDRRISKGIADGDKDIEHNWGYLEGRLFHLDPGRLFYDPALKEQERLKKEWENGTEELSKWLNINHMDHYVYLHSKIESIVSKKSF